MQKPRPSSDSWISKLVMVLKPVPHPLASAFPQNPSSRKHLPGHIWKHVFTKSVFYDLSGTLGELENLAKPGSSWWRSVRLECMGLSGMIVYAIRSPTTSEMQHETSSTDPGTLTLKKAFGDFDDPHDPGMTVDDLLDAVGGKMLFFPAYSCTSFVIGQAVHAAFSKQPSACPVTDRNGFSVLREEYTPSWEPSEAEGKLDESILPFPDYLGPSKESLDDVEDTEERALLTLCVRSSKIAPALVSHLDLGDSSDEDDNSKDYGDSSILTIDSLGPETPYMECTGAITCNDKDLHLSLLRHSSNPNLLEYVEGHIV